LPPHFAPGQHFEYGGLAMQTAGRMAEVAVGKDWETIFQEKIAKPLGMTRTRFTPVDPAHAPMLAGSAVSTLRDYAKFLTMIADGGVFEGRRILSEKAVAEMQADQVGAAAVKRMEFVERMRGNTHRGVYGLGMWREEIAADGKATLISSPSWAGAYPWIDKRHDIRGVNYVGKQGHVPLAMRLFLPEVWLEAPTRLDKAGVPEGERRALTKGEIALELLDAVRAEGNLPGQRVVGDCGYGVSGACAQVSPSGACVTCWSMANC
jgi:CubicO group peptidase (beta-lactamase class C family)